MLLVKMVDMKWQWSEKAEQGQYHRYPAVHKPRWKQIREERKYEKRRDFIFMKEREGKSSDMQEP